MDNKLIGTVQGARYTIREVIGVGGMSVVYKAYDALEDRFVALKVLKDEFLADQHFRRRFLNESRAIALLSHPNIVDVFDVNFDGDVQYIVMEYIEGKTLKEWMVEKGPLPLMESIHYTCQILSALRHAHERGVVHRDIKPHNIMLLEDGTIKVADFGIAHVSNFDTVTMTDKAIGSVHYLSPEQAKGQPTDQKSDLYSVGIILYEMMTGVLPFDGDSPVSVALMQIQTEPKAPTELRPDIPKGMEQIILKAIRKKPASRYQDAESMIDDLITLARDTSVTFAHEEEPGTEDEPTTEIRIIRTEEEQKEEKSPKSSESEDQTKRKKYLKWSRFRNKLIAITSGMFLAFILALLFLGAMFTMTSRFAERLIDVPALVGRSMIDVEADLAVTKNFVLKQESRYDDTVAAGIIIEQSPEDGQFSSGKEITVVVSKGKRMVSVPRIVNVAENQAIVLLKEQDLTYERIPQVSDSVEEGKIIRSEPAPDEVVAVGTSVKIYVSIKTTAEQVFVPDVVGETKDNAVSIIYQNKLLCSIQEVYDETVPAGKVIAQSLEAESIAEAGTEIMLIVSKGSILAALEQQLPETEVTP